MGTRDDRPEPALPKVGSGTPPPGWYPDPGGGRGLRWWDGARWTAHVAMPRVPPVNQDLAALPWVFGTVFVLALGSFLVASILVMGSDTCNSDRCFDLYGRAWLLLMAAHLALLFGCLATFLVGVSRKRVAVQIWAICVLPIGIVAAWIVYAVLAGIALDA